MGAVRPEAKELPGLVPVNSGSIGNLAFPPDRYVFAALDAGASTSVADIASSNSVGDHMKMFYREFL